MADQIRETSPWVELMERRRLVVARAQEVLRDRDEAARWLHRPLKALGGATPLDAARTTEGAQRVFDALFAIEDGESVD